MDAAAPQSIELTACMPSRLTPDLELAIRLLAIVHHENDTIRSLLFNTV
jgi:hypothetical protein